VIKPSYEIAAILVMIGALAYACVIQFIAGTMGISGRSTTGCCGVHCMQGLCLVCPSKRVVTRYDKTDQCPVVESGAWVDGLI
jgi:hypothetical protein